MSGAIIAYYKKWEILILSLLAPWPEVKELLKEVNSELSGEDLIYEPEKGEELIQRLSVKMGRTKEHIKAWIESVSANTRPSF